MYKPYLEILAEYHLANNRNLIERGKIVSDLFDKIIVWIVSLSTGSIALLLSNFDKISFANKKEINQTLIFLVLVIVIGIVGRVLYALASYLSFRLISDLDFRLQMQLFPHKIKEIDGSETAETIYEWFSVDFKIDVPLIIEFKKSLPKDKGDIADESAREYYKNYTAWSKNNLIDSSEIIAEQIEKAFGYKEGYLSNQTGRTQSNRLKGVVMRFSTGLSYFFYIVCVFLFACAIVYLVTIFIAKS